MARGNSIIVSCQPNGRFVEGKIAAAQTPKPGQVVQLDLSIAYTTNNCFTWKIYDADADGGRPKGPFIILLPDHLQGKLASDAYAAGDRAFGYIPLPGDELNLLLLDIAGTGDDHTIGEMLIVDDTTGKFIATTGSPETEVAQLLETVTDPAADTLAWAIWTGY